MPFSDTFSRFGIDRLFVSTPENIRFLTGFSGSFGVIIVEKNGGTTLFTDTRYLDGTRKMLAVPVFPITDLKKALPEGEAIGVEAENLTLSRFSNLKKKFKKRQWKTVSGVIEALRRKKSTPEIEALCRATEIAKMAFEAVIPRIKEGITERQIAWEFEKTARELGADTLSFPTIVAFGENSAIPHHQSTDRRLAREEAVLIDFGVQKNGFCSDCTRSFWFGKKPSKSYKMTWELVKQAQGIGIKTAKSGTKTATIDRAVRESFGDLSAEFLHGTGHGVGLAIHEAPTIGQKSTERLALGDTITIEPGLYRAGAFGVRIEDFGVINENGLELFPAAETKITLP